MLGAAFRCGRLPRVEKTVRGGLLKLWGAGRRVLRLRVAIAMNAHGLKLPRPSLLTKMREIAGPGRAGREGSGGALMSELSER